MKLTINHRNIKMDTCECGQSLEFSSFEWGKYGMSDCEELVEILYCPTCRSTYSKREGNHPINKESEIIPIPEPPDPFYEDPYQMGHRAGFDTEMNGGNETNPYEYGTSSYNEWDRGFSDGCLEA